MKAIALPYTVEQNSPSRPVPKIINLPTNIEDRDELLKQLFVDNVLGEGYVEEFGEPEINIEEGNEDDYGDLIVSAFDDQFLFVTFLKEE